MAWWLGVWVAGWVASVRGRIGARLGWDSAGLGVGGSRLGWIGRGRGLIGVRQDWARWIGRGWGLGSTGARLARLGARLHWRSAGAVGARVHWGSGAGGLGVGARELERGLDWGVVGLGAAGLGTIVAS